MKRIILAVLCLVAVLSIATVAGAAKTYPKNRLSGKLHGQAFGPFCVSESNGIMRAVRTGQACHPGERRIFHLIIGSRIVRRVVVKGTPGVAGKAGAKGDTGKTGATGPKGDTGAQGIPGIAGATGANGINGTSAGGGTGAQGPKGDTGATGPAGPAGATGATGATGAQGPAGPAGPAGSSTGCINNCGGNNGSGSGSDGCVQNCGGDNSSDTTTTLCVGAGNAIRWGGDDGSMCAANEKVLTVVVKN